MWIRKKAKASSEIAGYCFVKHALLVEEAIMNMQSSAPYAAMVLVQLSYGGSNILMKIALEKGLNQLVFVVYRHIIAMILLAPFAFVIERKQRPPLSLSVMIKIFVLSSLGTTIHLNVYYAGLAYTSPTVASALSNVIPSLTFIMAVLLGMEKVKTESPRGWSKMLGTAICVSGSLVFTFWKGGYLFKSFENRPLINIYSTKGSSGEYRHAKENWIKGAALILTSHVAWSAWLILQAVVYKVYPARLSLTTLICFFASIQSSFLALCFARTPAIWKLDWNVQLLTIIYCGVVISALVYYLQTWCISHKGPVFVAMFSPLLVVIVGLFSAIAFAERLHLGSLVGTGLIVLGLYCVLWGKGQDNSAAQKPDEGKGLADDKTLEISINDHPLTNPDTGERM
ncbi:WAT1-related protein [Salix suchowensis]|nr:WAT1-related protein [Salix suchowensis]